MARILIIEDADDERNALVELLSGSGHDVCDAPNGKVALQLLRNEKPVELAITDMLMPEMDGVETIVALKRDYPGLKIMAVSGGGVVGSNNYLRLARNLGAHAVLAKPFTPTELESAIKALMGEK